MYLVPHNVFHVGTRTVESQVYTEKKCYTNKLCFIADTIKLISRARYVQDGHVGRKLQTSTVARRLVYIICTVCGYYTGMCTRPFYSRPRRDRDRDQGLQSSRPRRGRGVTVPTLKRDRAEALLRLETASRPRRQDRGHFPHSHHSEF